MSGSGLKKVFERCVLRCIMRALPGPLAQPVEQLTFNQLVGRSNRPRPTIYQRLTLYWRELFFGFPRKPITAAVEKPVCPGRRCCLIKLLGLLLDARFQERQRDAKQSFASSIFYFLAPAYSANSRRIVGSYFS